MMRPQIQFRNGSQSAEFPEGEALRVPHPESPGVLHHRRQDPGVCRQRPAQGEQGHNVVLQSISHISVLDRAEYFR